MLPEPPPAVWEDSAKTGAREAEDQDDQRQHQQAAKLAAAFDLFAFAMMRFTLGKLALLLARGCRDSGRRGALHCR